MSISLTGLRAALPAGISGVALMMMGCTDATNRQDIADARAVLEKEQEATADVIREGEEKVAEARREAYEASQPILEEGREDVAEVEREVVASIRQQQKEEHEAADELRTAEHNLQERQARDAYVKQVEHRLHNIEHEIDQLEERASNTEGAEKEDLNQQIETLQAQHERAEEALQELRDAELDDWKVHQQHVRIAMQDLDSGLSNIR